MAADVEAQPVNATDEGASLLPPPSAVSSSTNRRRRRHRATVIGAVAGGALLLLAVAATVTALLVLRSERRHSREYGVMLDAGSSGTRAYVYSWPRRMSATDVPAVSSGGDATVAQLQQQFQQQRAAGDGAAYREVKPGIAHCNASDVAAYLAPLLDWARTLLPAGRVQETPIYLRATAGMRMIDPSAQAEIIAAARRALGESGLRFEKDEWARVISGEEEGVFGWVTTAFLTGELAKPASESANVGALDMGGASLQITFVPEHQPPPTDARTITIAGRDHRLYTHTFLARGQDTTLVRVNEAVVRASVANGTAADVVMHPCFLQGYSEQYFNADIDARNHTLAGSGRAAECAQLLVDLLNTTAPCAVPPCSFDGASQPPVFGKFYAMSGFYYTASFFGVPETNTTSPQRIQTLANDYCGKTWSQAKAEHPGVSEKNLKMYCLTGQYIHALLVNGFRFADADNQSVFFTGDINSTTLNWALGAMIYEASLLPWKN